jgi:flagellar basal body P-ring protein FlgI
MERRSALLLLCLIPLAGCSSWNLSKTAKTDDAEAKDAPERLVGDIAVPYGMDTVSIESVGLVTGLHGTGSDPEPSGQRSMLLDEMQRRGVHNPNEVLASKDVSLVLVRAILRPGIQKGDRFDVEVRIPGNSETTSLRGGYLLETRLMDMAVLADGMLHNGKVRGLAQGPVLVDPAATEANNRVGLGRGRVLGGGIAQQPRSMGLVLKPGHQDVASSARVASSINKRFNTFDKGNIKVGVAKAKTHEYVDLIVHPRYKENIERYFHVLRAVALQETTAELSDRISELEKHLEDPASAGQAALQLEAIGKRGIDSLVKGIASPNREVRFFAAEALAYLDQPQAAKPLAEAARDEPAFRMYALTALSSMEDFAAYEQLRDLLAVPSVETRYGAFRALWMMNPNDPLVRGEECNGQFRYHVLDTGDEHPVVHVTRNRRAEVVLFGRDQRFATPLSVNAGNQIMVTSTNNGQISVSRITSDESEHKRVVSTRVDDVIRAIAAVGGTYPDVVQALEEAKVNGALASRFEVDAVPEAGRTYQREETAADDDDKKKPADADEAKDEENPGFFARLTGKSEK